MPSERPAPRVLLTGASSFSGMWIAGALAAAGCTVVAPLRRREEDYSGLRLERVRRLGATSELCFEVDVTTPAVDEIVRSLGPFDVLAHHAADIANYRDPNYEVAEGVARNTSRMRHLIRLLADGGTRAVVATGTTFEPDPRLAPAERFAVSSYGLSKSLTNQALHHFAHWEGLDFARFVVAAPFGPLEEGRFVWSLFQAWLSGRPAQVRTPAYVRDNLPVELLARAYTGLVIELPDRRGDRVARPSGFVGTQGAFALRVAREVEARLGRTCAVEAAVQTDFPEPLERVNDEPAIPADWDESAFWDAYVDYYLRIERLGLLQAIPS